MYYTFGNLLQTVSVFVCSDETEVSSVTSIYCTAETQRIVHKSDAQVTCPAIGKLFQNRCEYRKEIWMLEYFTTVENDMIRF